jgi:high-affinity nickel-transport protein
MFPSLALLGIGLLLGMRHAVDPDHVVAVTTIVSRQPSLARASAIGALWGVGHTGTILLLGGAIILFRIAIPPRLGLAMELGVAIMLIVLGLLNLSGRTLSGMQSALRPLIVGFAHGLAGSAFVAMLVVAAIPQPLMGVAYLLTFGLGTIAGMILVTVAIATPSVFAAKRFGHVQRYLRVASGVVSIAFGIFLAHEVSIVHGLFTSNPTWTPK